MEHDCVLLDLLTIFLFDQIEDVNHNITVDTQCPFLIVKQSDAIREKELAYYTSRRAWITV